MVRMFTTDTCVVWYVTFILAQRRCETTFLPRYRRAESVARYATPRKALRGGISKSIFQRPCQFLAIDAHKMAPRTNQWLQERTWNAPTKGLAWTLPLSLSHSLTPSLLHSLTSSLSRSLTASLPHFFTPSLSHSFTPSLLHSLALSLSHSLPTAPSHSFTNSLPHPLTLSLPTLLHSLTLTLLRSLNPRGQRTRVHPTPKPVPLFRVRYSQVLLSVFVTSFFFSAFVTSFPCSLLSTRASFPCSFLSSL